MLHEYRIHVDKVVFNKVLETGSKKNCIVSHGTVCSMLHTEAPLIVTLSVSGNNTAEELNYITPLDKNVA